MSINGDSSGRGQFACTSASTVAFHPLSFTGSMYSNTKQ